MGLLKRVLFMIIPIATLLIALAYGIEVIFGTDLTYLGWTSPNGVNYPNVYDFKSYLEALQIEDLATPIKNAINSITQIKRPVQNMQNVWNNGYDFGDISVTIINIFVILLDIVIWIFNMICAIFQTALIIIFKILSIFGIKITGSENPTAIIFNGIKDWQQLPLLNGLTGLNGNKPTLNGSVFVHI